jgi:TRAP-type C4-dicarboxylate transport system permease small subunit
MYRGIVAAVEASEHCGIKTAVAMLTERARSARRASILVAIAAMKLLMCFTFYVAKWS